MMSTSPALSAAERLSGRLKRREAVRNAARLVRLKIVLYQNRIAEVYGGLQDTGRCQVGTRAIKVICRGGNRHSATMPIQNMARSPTS